MAAIFQTTLSNAFSCMKMLEFRFKFHWSLFLRVQLTIVYHWFRWWFGADQATSHYLNQWWLDYWRIYASLGLNELSEAGQRFWYVKYATAEPMHAFVLSMNYIDQSHNSQIPHCIRWISHNAKFFNRNVHMCAKCTHMHISVKNGALWAMYHALWDLCDRFTRTQEMHPIFYSGFERNNIWKINNPWNIGGLDMGYLIWMIPLGSWLLMWSLWLPYWFTKNAVFH